MISSNRIFDENDEICSYGFNTPSLVLMQTEGGGARGGYNGGKIFSIGEELKKKSQSELERMRGKMWSFFGVLVWNESCNLE